ncbi:MAG: ParB/RepB/Spo0J family partition protein [Polyangiales bacterium]
MDTADTDITTVAPTDDTAAEQLARIALGLIDESATNPRKRFDAAKLSELADDIKAHGLIQPVIVRPQGDRYELVVGARRFRASALAGSTTILARVRDYSDREVCEVQLTENGQRDDVHPLEEADGYEHLRAQGAALEELAARTGKSVSYVRHRLQYCALCPEAREAFFDGRLSPATALLVARIPVASLQVEAVAKVTAVDWRGETPTVREAGDLIRGHFMLKLADAPFDRGDATLTSAGACTTCPKRTGAQPELFADVESADTCTDPVCFVEKREVSWQAVTKKAKAKGQAVLGAAETKKVFPYGTHVAHNCGYVDVAEKSYAFDYKTPKALLGKGNLPPTMLARDPQGGVHELVKADDLKKALKAAGISDGTRALGPSGDEQKKIRERLAVQRVAMERALGQIVTAVEGDEATLAVWRFVAGCIVERGWSDECAVVAKRRGVEVGSRHATGEALTEIAGEMSESELRGLVVEVLCGSPPNMYSSGHSHRLVKACELYGIDLKAIEREVTAESGAK